MKSIAISRDIPLIIDKYGEKIYNDFIIIIKWHKRDDIMWIPSMSQIWNGFIHDEWFEWIAKETYHLIRHKHDYKLIQITYTEYGIPFAFWAIADWADDR